MKLPGNKTLVWIAVALVVAWFVIRQVKAQKAQAGRNSGQAGSIFQPWGATVGGGQ